jgi:Uma2 family endonuclease
MQPDIAPRTMTAGEFEQCSLRPENADRRLELVNGEVIEWVSSDVSSVIAMTIIRIKVSNYLSAGTTVWVADPERKRIEVYAPGVPVSLAGRGDTLDGGAILPGFSLAVSDVFPA